VALVALACAAAGPITFIALAAPQLSRRLTASAGVGLMPSAAMGAVLLLGSDVIAQHLFGGNELPVGAVTVSLGGAYLIYLLVTQARKR
jgi:iron-siderophore transport system permease protein